MSIARLGILSLLGLLHSIAVAEPIVPGARIKGGADGDCPLLGTSITLQLSRQVKGAFLCGTEAIGLSTCHPLGRRKLTLSNGSDSETGVVFQALTGGRLGQIAGCPLGYSPIPDSLVRSGTP